jgi:hypothetical protein
MNAGGKLNSRPHNRPTFFIALAPQQNLRIILTIRKAAMASQINL